MFVFQTGLRTRNPLLRLVGSLLGLLAVLAVLALGMFAFAAFVIVGAVWLLIGSLRGKTRRPPSAGSPVADKDVIDGEFTVVRETDRHAVVEHTGNTASSGQRG
jgi:hypothetical protein